MSKAGQLPPDWNLSAMRWPRQLEEREGRILFALRSFQLIETTLKMYLSGPRAGLAEDPDSVDPDVANLALGKLIRRFKKHNTNTALHQELDGILDERNLIAHQALITGEPGTAGILRGPVMYRNRLREIDRKANRVAHKLLIEFIDTTPRRETT